MNEQYINPYKLFKGIFIPNFIKSRTPEELSSTAKLVYAELCKFSGENGKCYPSQETLASELGFKDVRQIRRAIKELKENCLIENKQRGWNQTSTYMFLDHKWMYEKTGSFRKVNNNNGL